jgi:hypothetical protein
MLDATGNPPIPGNYYGYSQSNNGLSTTVIGLCRKTENNKITLEKVREVQYYGGHHHKTIHTERARTVYSNICFPIDINNLKHH